MAKSVKACARVNQMCVWNINQYRLGFCGQKHCQLEQKGSETGRLSLHGTGQDEGAIRLWMGIILLEEWKWPQRWEITTRAPPSGSTGQTPSPWSLENKTSLQSPGTWTDRCGSQPPPQGFWKAEHWTKADGFQVLHYDGIHLASLQTCLGTAIFSFFPVSPFGMGMFILDLPNPVFRKHVTCLVSQVHRRGIVPQDVPYLESHNIWFRWYLNEMSILRF